MNDIIAYLIKVSAGTILLYLCFAIFYNKDTFYNRNRIILILTMIIPMIIPLIRVAGFEENPIQSEEPTIAATVVNSVITTGGTFSQSVNSIDYSGLVTGIWLSVSLLLVLRMLAGLIKTASIIKAGTLISDKFPRLVISDLDHPPFSFYPYAVIPRKIIDNGNAEDIIMHENAHLRQGHTFDLLACELFACFFWFNPVAWFLKKSLRMNHEYMADNQIKASSFNLKEYQYKLLDLPEDYNPIQLAHSFNSLTKNRIIMINKRPTQTYASLKNLIIFPVVVFIFAAFSFKAVQSTEQVSPRRVVFEGSLKTQEINLANTGNDSTKYIISLINYKMDDDGRFTEIKSGEMGQNTAEKYIKFIPETLLLAPGEERKIKIELINTGLLETGEYRSHVYFRHVPIKNESPDPASMKKTSIFGYTIPVIIRVGKSTMKVGFSDLKLNLVNDTIPKLQLTFNRTGNFSVYGNLEISHISPQGKITPVGSVKGIAVYTPNSIRRFTVDLDKKAGINYHVGSLHVTYSAQDTSEKYAEADLGLR